MSKARDELLYDEMVKFENKVSKLEAENLKKDSIISDLQILKSEKFAMIKKIQKLEAEKAELYKELKRIMDADESEFLDLYFLDNTAELLQKYEG